MYKHIVRLLSIGMFLLASSPLATAETNSYVEGVLKNAKGDPAVGFTVSIIGASPSSTYQADAITDQHGEFHVSNLEFGSYVAAPHLDTMDSRYPPGTSAFYNKHLTRFNLRQESPEVKLSLELDAPCLLMAGTITDRITGQPLVGTIHIWHKDDKEKWVRFGSAATGVYRTWIPAGEALEVVVSAPNYQEFRTTIQALRSGEDLSLDIPLTPLGGKHQAN